MATTSIRPEGIDRQERTRVLLQQLEQGFQSVKESDRYTEYLKFCARFHNYSAHNCVLIMLQRPLASNVAGFNTWKSLGRYVRKGEKGIQILAPRPYRRTTENGDGEEETIEGIYFQPVHVFDVAQTEGDELPSPNDRLTGDDNGLWNALRTLALRERLAVDQRANESTAANGFYRKADRRIWVRPDMSPAQSAKTLAHELAHYFAEHDVNGHCRNEAETIAESAAYIVLAHFGIDAGAYSFGYLASWTDIKTFKAALREVQHVAQRIIDGLAVKEQKLAA